MKMVCFARLRFQLRRGSLLLNSVSNGDWSGRLDLNQRLPEPHSGALPGCATSRFHNGIHSIPGSCFVKAKNRQPRWAGRTKEETSFEDQKSVDKRNNE
jgi:hypothetical protein